MSGDIFIVAVVVCGLFTPTNMLYLTESLVIVVQTLAGCLQYFAYYK